MNTPFNCIHTLVLHNLPRWSPSLAPPLPHLHQQFQKVVENIILVDHLTLSADGAWLNELTE